MPKSQCSTCGNRHRQDPDRGSFQGELCDHAQGAQALYIVRGIARLAQD
jgi:hypothetical protein